MSAPPSEDMTSKHTFLEATLARRSTIALSSDSPIPDSRIVDLVKHAIKHAPSPFHVQSTRAVVLLGEKHQKFWDLAFEESKKHFPGEVFDAKFAPNLKAYRAGHGTVLFFDDPGAVNNLPPPLASLIKSFPEWADHSNAMAQYAAWTALCDSGLGANLQHYQKYVGPALNEFAGVPQTWTSPAQLVFGTPAGPPRGGVEKQFADIDARVKVLGA